MLEQLYQFAAIGKYIVIGLGAIGIVMLLLGAYRHDRKSIARGGYMLLLAIVFWICGYAIYEVTKDKVNHKMYEIQEEYRNLYR